MPRSEGEYAAREAQDLGADSAREFDLLFESSRAQLEETFRERHHKLLAMTALFKETLIALQQRGWTIHAQLWNTGIRVNIAAADLSVLIWQVCAERDIWARKLAARQLALTLFQVTEDLTQALGGPIRKGLEALNRSADETRSAIGYAPCQDRAAGRSAEHERDRGAADALAVGCAASP